MEPHMDIRGLWGVGDCRFGNFPCKKKNNSKSS